VFDGPPPPCIKLPLEYAIVLSWDEKGMGVQVHISVGDTAIYTVLTLDLNFIFR